MYQSTKVFEGNLEYLIILLDLFLLLFFFFFKTNLLTHITLLKGESAVEGKYQIRRNLARVECEQGQQTQIVIATSWGTDATFW